MNHGRESGLHCMTTFLLIPGAGGVSWYWHRVSGRLRGAGQRAIAVDLPGDDPSAGLSHYADLVVTAADGEREVVLVAQSMGGFTALMAYERLPVRRLVLINAMIPAPGETPGDWWENTGSEPARTAAARARGYGEEFDVATYFLHDVPPDVAEAGADHQRDEADAAFDEPCTFTSWPAEVTTVFAGRDDRFFPFEFQRRVTLDRVGIEVGALPGGHLNALSEPDAVSRALLRV
jgi:pimeloyl-ACP methyl ester carboxylesterase